MIRVKNPQDFWAGLLFIAFGAAALWFGRDFPVGTAMKMGPGYLPLYLSWGVVGIGAFVTLRALAIEGPAVEPSRIRPQVFILLAIVVFRLMIERFGLAPAVAVIALIASFASYEMKIIESLVLAAGLAAASILLFIYLLAQSMDPWAWNI